MNHFIRAEDGAIINVAQVQAFTVGGGEKYNGNTGNIHGYFVYAHFGPTVYNQSRIPVCFCNTHAEADHELDCLFETLTRRCGSASPDPIDRVVDSVTTLHRAPAKRGLDPFDEQCLKCGESTTETFGGFCNDCSGAASGLGTSDTSDSDLADLEKD